MHLLKGEVVVSVCVSLSKGGGLNQNAIVQKS